MGAEDDLRPSRHTLGAKKDLVISYWCTVTVAKVKQSRVEIHLLHKVPPTQYPLRESPQVHPADAVRTRCAVVEVEAVDVDSRRHCDHVPFSSCCPPSLS